MGPERKLSSLERFFYDRSRLNLHSCFFLGLQLNQLPSRNQIARALRTTIGKYPQLHQNVAIDPEDRKPFIKNVGVIEFDDVVEYVEWDRFDEEATNYVFRTYNFPYFVEKPLWKILIHEKESRLLLLLDHALFDGISAVIFWKSFMSSLSSDSNDGFDVLYRPERGSITQEHAHAYDMLPTSWGLMAKKVVLGTIFKLMPSIITSTSGNQFRFLDYSFPHGLLTHKSDDDYPYQIRNDNCQLNICVEPARLSDLLSACKFHRVSLTSLISAVLAISLRQNVEDGKSTGSKIKIDIPMNTRGACAKLLGSSDCLTSMGNFVAGATIDYDLHGSATIWETAEIIHAQLTNQTKTDVMGTIDNVRLLDAADTTNFIRQKVKATGPAGTFEVTNLGAQEFAVGAEVQGQFCVEDAFFNEPQGLSDIFTCCTISTPQGGLTCSVSYPRDIKSSVEPCLDFLRSYLVETIDQVKA